MSMTPDLRSFDLNLLHTLVVLLDSASVSEAGRTLGITQSAASRALGRLRTVFDDPLLVRVGQHMVPTEKALALHPEVRAWVGSTRRLLALDPTFDPGTHTGTVHLAVSDYFQAVLLPSLWNHLRHRAPHLDLRVSSGFRSANGLVSRSVDGLLGATGTLSAPDIVQTPLFEGSFTVVTRSGHPWTRTRDLTSYLQHRHLLVSHDGDRTGVVDRTLRSMNLERNVCVLLPDFLGAFEWVARTDLVATLPTRVADLHRHRDDLSFSVPPLSLPSFRLAFFWHEQRRTDPLHAWLRAQIQTVARNLL